MQFEQLGPYRLEHAVGRGGMGAVYAAVHVETGEACAIKVLSGAIADDEHFRDRFKGEVETLQTLRHPNIVRLLGYGEQDGRLFYAMELVEGVNLQETLADKRYGWSEVIDFSVQVCAALKHAHDHGVIHRDLKPANLLLTKDNQIKLTDFGIAKLFGSTQLTAAGGVIGTADYMSPEQADGSPITNRTDLYSLGCVMYALLTRKPPFAGRTLADVLHALKYDKPAPVSSRAYDTPTELEDLIMQLLAKDPAERIANAMLVSKRLQAMKHGLERRAQDDDDDEYKLSDEEPRTSVATGLPTSARPTVDLSTSDSGQSTQASQPLSVPLEEGDETIVTEVAGRLQSSETQRHRAPETHFVTVEEAEGGGGGRRKKKTEQHQRGALLSTLGLGGLLVLVVVAIVVGLQPPSANKLYAQIESVASTADADRLVEVLNPMDDFLRLYPDDPRSPVVKALLADYDAHRLWRRLERRARKQGDLANLSEIQATYVEGHRARPLDAGKARALFLSVVDAERSEDPEDAQDDAECQASAAHCAMRLQPTLIPKPKEESPEASDDKESS